MVGQTPRTPTLALRPFLARAVSEGRPAGSDGRPLTGDR